MLNYEEKAAAARADTFDDGVLTGAWLLGFGNSSCETRAQATISLYSQASRCIYSSLYEVANNVILFISCTLQESIGLTQ